MPADLPRAAVQVANLEEDEPVLLDQRVQAVVHLLLVLLVPGVAVPEVVADEQDDAGEEDDGADDNCGDYDRYEQVRVRRRWCGGGEEDGGDHGAGAGNDDPSD
jgi:hypothetical protein